MDGLDGRPRTIVDFVRRTLKKANCFEEDLSHRIVAQDSLKRRVFKYKAVQTIFSHRPGLIDDLEIIRTAHNCKTNKNQLISVILARACF